MRRLDLNRRRAALSHIKPVKDAKRKIQITSVQLCGENAGTHFITIVCNCGLNTHYIMFNAVHFVNRNGYSEFHSPQISKTTHFRLKKVDLIIYVIRNGFMRELETESLKFKNYLVMIFARYKDITSI